MLKHVKYAGVSKIISNLRDHGYKIRISHHRVLNGVGKEVGVKDNYQEIDTLLTRGEYEHARAENQLVFDDYGLNLFPQVNTADQLSFGEIVSPTGGFTLVEITTPEGATLRGKCSFKNSAFWRRYGVRIALAKAIGENKLRELADNPLADNPLAGKPLAGKPLNV